MINTIFQEDSTPIDTSILGGLGFIDIQGWKLPVLGLILYLVILPILYLIYKLIKKLLNDKYNLKLRSPDLYNGIKFGLRIIIFVLFLISTTYFLNVESEYILIISGIIITAITFANMKSINNFIAGVYISITRPFTVGDFVDINGLEGIVTEISLNHTTIKHKDASYTSIPNISCLGSNIINYSISIEWYKKQISNLESLIQINYKKLAENEDPGLRVIAHRMNEELQEMRQILTEIEGLQKSFKRRELEREKFENDLEQLRDKQRKRWEQEEKEEEERMNNLWAKIEKEQEELNQLRRKQKERWKKELEDFESKHAKKDKKFREELKEKEMERIEKEEDEYKKLKENQEKRWKDTLKKEKLRQRELKEKWREMKSEERSIRRQMKKDYRDKYRLYKKGPKRSNFVDNDKIVRYVFKIQLDRDHSRNAEILNQICQEWSDEFEITPNWEVSGLGSKIEYQITLMTPDPYDLIHYYDEFIEDVYEMIYKKE